MKTTKHGLNEKEMELAKLLMADCKTTADVQNKLKELFAGKIEQMLEAELDEHLGYDKNSPLGNNTGHSRNGYGRKSITSELAIETIKQAFERNNIGKDGIILHSNQGSQFTSKEFMEFCETMNIKQSMSRAGCPYDNEPVERFYNTLKNGLVNLHSYQNDEQLNKSIYDFEVVWYNHGRPHSHNNGLTPYQARMRPISK